MLFCLAFTSCMPYKPTTSLNYTPRGLTTAPSSPARYSVTVVPFTENREARFYPSTFARSFILYIPLVPYVKIPYERLDESYLITERDRGLPAPKSEHFTRKMAAAVADDLRASGLFSDVQFAAGKRASAEATTDFVLEGSLNSTAFGNYQTVYGLAFPGVMLWILPFPMFWQTATVDVTLALRENGKDRPVWEYQLQEWAWTLFTSWNGYGAPISSSFSLTIKRYGHNDRGIDDRSFWAYHAEALQDGMAKAKVSLAAYLAGRSQ